MRSRPYLAYKVLKSTPQEWFGRPLREVHDADIARWIACERAAKTLLGS